MRIPLISELSPAGAGAFCPVEAHVRALAAALRPFRRAAGVLDHWGRELAGTLVDGGRLLVAGNGGSAAEAQHLAAELVGKLREDRMPLSAIALTADTASLTAIGNDYGFDEVFARQVRAHGRGGDILLLLSTSGRSANLLAAAAAGQEVGMRCWAFTGPAPNPLAEACAEVLAVPSPDSQVVQELHLVSAHVLCEFVDRALPELTTVPPPGDRPPVALASRVVSGQARPPSSPPGEELILATRANGVRVTR
jgi:D-sedoheptulose 7-phosphate isomerase